MRQRRTRKGIAIKAYAGTTGVLLAFNVTKVRRRGLLGFAIHREGGGAEDRWLRGLLRFPSELADPNTPVDSSEAPIQKFRWSDYSVYPDSNYTYTVHGVYGQPGSLRLVEGGQVQIMTGPAYTSGPYWTVTFWTGDGKIVQRPFNAVGPCSC
jgi:hypothetical protein